MANRKTASVRLSTFERLVLDRLAAARGMTFSCLIRSWIEDEGKKAGYWPKMTRRREGMGRPPDLRFVED